MKKNVYYYTVIFLVLCLQCKQRQELSGIQSQKAISEMHSSMLQGLCIEETHKPSLVDLSKNQQAITNTMIRDFLDLGYKTFNLKTIVIVILFKS